MMTSSLPVSRSADKLTPIITLCLVFLSGAVSGAVIMSTFGHSILHNPPVTVGGVHQMSVNDWKKQLDLTDEQTNRLKSTLDDFSTYYDNVLGDGNSRILAILNESQKKKFEKMLIERKGK